MPDLALPRYEILEYPRSATKNIERAARLCYKSEDRITEGSDERLTRGLLKRKHEAMVEFGGWIVVQFLSNRGFTHELVRHRLASFAQESTRWCDYSKGKFGGGITCLDPASVLATTKLSLEDQAWAKGEMILAWLVCEDSYLRLTQRGVPAEIAREVLPIGLKAEIMIGATVREWRHIFKMRCAPPAHPRMRELMGPLRDELRSLIPVVFDAEED